jgi:hypothetical protein
VCVCVCVEEEQTSEINMVYQQHGSAAVVATCTQRPKVTRSVSEDICICALKTLKQIFSVILIMGFSGKTL